MLGFLIYNIIYNLIFIDMQYIKLGNIQNQYPSIFNYTRKSEKEIRLKGIYPQNFVDFQTPDLSQLQVIESSSFKFILELKFSDDDDEYLGLYTSRDYYRDLIDAYEQNNPYPLQNAFNKDFVVKFNVNDISKTYNELKDPEIELDVKVNRNIFYKFEGDNEYDRLVNYINWVVSKPSANEIGQNNVLPVSQISEYTYAQYVPDSDSFEYIDDAYNVVRLSKLENELININFSIAEIEDYLKNPDDPKFRVPGNGIARLVGPGGISLLNKVGGEVIKGIIAKIIPGALLGPLGIIIGTVAAAASFVVQLVRADKKKEEEVAKIEEHINRLKSELVKLKERRRQLIDEIEKLKG